MSKAANSITPEARRLTRIVMLVIAVWGGLLSVGALLYGLDIEESRAVLQPNPWRGLTVAGCVTLFLGGWWVALCRSGRI